MHMLLDKTRSVSVARETVVQDALWTKGNNSNNSSSNQCTIIFDFSKIIDQECQSRSDSYPGSESHTLPAS